MSTIYVPVDTIKKFMSLALQKSGVPEPDAEIVVDVLISSDLRGIESHGIGRLKMYLDFIKAGVQNPVTDIQIVKETPGTALLDGNFGMGHVISYRAMELAIKKAKQTGIAAIAVRNSTHLGICGYYPLMAVKQSMAGLAFTNARPSVVPTFGVDPMFGTNPIGFGVPTDEDCPFLLDMATSIGQRGKIEVFEREKKNIPEGWAITRDGEYITDPGELIKATVHKVGALLPLGGLGEETSGHKGYGLALMVEILSSCFSGGPFGWDLSGFDKNGKKIPNRLGHFFIAIDISHFIEVERFKKIAGDIARSMRNSAKYPGEKRIYTAGEKEFLKEQKIPQSGIPVNDSLQKVIKDTIREYQLEIKMPF
ncbi:Ldh family oxidoreductase [candidate division KSB1 bacterium]|nr:Ldh family oxidoreductase [candidate division KSB1 bacterium]